MRITEINQRKLITESWNDPKLSLLESRVIIPFVEDIERYIVEAQLSPEQISQLFTSAEQGMTASGKNRTMVGKGKDAVTDAAKFIDSKINELGRSLANAGPVKNADAKFDELKAKIGAKDTKVVNAIKGVSDWAKANPAKASVAVAILTTAAAMAGGPLGGAIAGFLARATKDLLQGEQLSTAVGKSVKTAAYGAIAGWALQSLGDWLEGIRADFVPYDKAPGLTTLEVGFTKELTAPGFKSVKDLGSMIIPEDQIGQFQALVDGLTDATAATGSTTDPAAIEAFNKLWNFTKTFDTQEFIKDMNLANNLAQEIAQQNDEFLQNLSAVNTAIASVAQGSITGKADTNDVKVDGKPAEQKENKTFTNLQIETLIEWCDDTPEVLTEGPLDALKKAGSAVGGALKKGASAVAKKAVQVGKNMTTKVTADKLNKAWSKAGKPTDSDEIANILRQAGVSDDVLAPIYKQFGAKLPPAPKPAEEPAQGGNAPAGQSSAPAQSSAAPAQSSGQPATEPTDLKGIQQAVAKLNPQQKQELIKHIDSLGQQGAAPAQDTAQDAKPTGNTPANAKAAPAADKNAAASDTYEKAKGDIRKVQGGTKPMPPKTAANIDAALAKLAKGDKESGVWAAQRIMTFAKAGVDVSKQQQAWIANSKAGERFLTQSVYFEISKMLREHGLRWSDLGLRIHLLEGTNAYIGISQL